MRTSLCQLAKPLWMSATPGMTHFVLPLSSSVTGTTVMASLVWLSSTEATAVTLPVEEVTETSTRPSSRVMPRESRKELSCVCCPPARLWVNWVICWPVEPKTLIRTVAAWPEPSKRARLERYFADCEICWREMLFVRSMKLAKGMAGMYWPKVPFAATLKVREEAKLTRLARAPMGGAVGELVIWVRGLISSTPMAFCVPVPNQLLRTSSSAMVRPGSMEKVVWRAALRPASPLGMKVSWYLMSWGEVFATRTSDWKWELMPSALATPGMIMVSGEGVFEGEGLTGVTTLTLMLGTMTVVAWMAMLPALGVFRVM